MVRRIIRRRVLPLDAGIVWSVIRDPAEFVPLWPYLERIEELEDRGGRIVLLLRRFGFSLRAEYELEVSRDDEGMVAVYRCTAVDKEFNLVASVESSEGGALVKVEASYSGPYESLSRPLLEGFANGLLDNLASKLRARPVAGPPALEAKPEVRWAGARLSLRDPEFITRAIIGGFPLDSGRLMVGEQGDLRQLLSRIAELSRGRVVLARIRKGPEGGLLVRILASNGRILDAYMEEGDKVEYGLSLLDKLPEKTLGSEVEYLILEVPRA